MTVKIFSILFFIVCTVCCYAQPNSIFPTIKLKTKLRRVNFSDFTPCYFSYINKKDSLVIKKLSGKTKYRGNSAAHYKKKSFSVKLSENVDFEDSKTSKNWKLNAEYIDKTFIRNKLSYDLFRKFSENNIAPKVNFVRLKINRKYHGLYTFIERLDANFLELKKDDTTAALFKEPPISQDPSCHNEHHENFVKYYNWAPRYKKHSANEMARITKAAYFNQRFPDISSRDKSHEIYRLTNFIYNSPDSIFSNEKIFNKFFNLQNIIDWQILLLVTNNADGVIKNFYLFKQSKDQPYLFCPWDYDHGFGRDGDGEIHTHNLIDFERMELINRLQSLNAFDYRSKLLSRFLELKQMRVLTTKSLKTQVIDLAWKINEEAIANEKKWPLKKIELFKDTKFSKEIELIIEWIPEQLERVENYLYSINKTGN